MGLECKPNPELTAGPGAGPRGAPRPPAARKGAPSDLHRRRSPTRSPRCHAEQTSCAGRPQRVKTAAWCRGGPPIPAASLRWASSTGSSCRRGGRRGHQEEGLVRWRTREAGRGQAAARPARVATEGAARKCPAPPRNREAPTRSWRGAPLVPTCRRTRPCRLNARGTAGAPDTIGSGGSLAPRARAAGPPRPRRVQAPLPHCPSSRAGGGSAVVWRR